MTRTPSKRKSTTDVIPPVPDAAPAPSIDFAARYQTTKEILLQARSHQFEYGKWLLASMLAVHGGSLVAISQAGDVREKLYEASGPFLIYGLAASMLAGGTAWFNFTFASQAYSRWLADLRQRREPETPKRLSVAVNWSMYLAIIFAVLSLALFVTAALSAAKVLKVDAKTYWYQTETTADDPQ
jgi:cytochrome bd-type quinol oxidase subunit 2